MTDEDEPSVTRRIIASANNNIFGGGAAGAAAAIGGAGAAGGYGSSMINAVLTPNPTSGFNPIFGSATINNFMQADNIEYKTTKFTELVDYICGPGHLKKSKFGQIVGEITNGKFNFNNFAIAGGSIRNLFMGKDFNDIDFFMCPKYDQQILNTALINKHFFGNVKYPALDVFKTSTYATTKFYNDAGYIFKVQYVMQSGTTSHKLLHGTPEQILGGFDFTINQFCLHSNDKITYSNYALGDLIARRLRIVNSNNILNRQLFLKRIKQFLEQGFILEDALFNCITINI